MTRYYCDLHIHSCLSPCADDDMTPANIAAMCMLNKLSVVALTDHNTSKNCPAFFAFAKKFGIVPIAGMELTTSEDIHAICLFRSLEAAMDFDSYVCQKRTFFQNRPDIFGHQYIMNENDEVVAEEENLLINAADISLDEAYSEVLKRDGVCYPAHIDRTSNGIISVLGVFPESPEFTAYELNDAQNLQKYLSENPLLETKTHAVSSDAHRLTDLREASFGFDIDDSTYSSDFVRNKIIDILLGRKG